MNGIRGREYSEVSGVLDGSRATVDRCCRPDPPSVSLAAAAAAAHVAQPGTSGRLQGLDGMQELKGGLTVRSWRAVVTPQSIQLTLQTVASRLPPHLLRRMESGLATPHLCRPAWAPNNTQRHRHQTSKYFLKY